MKNFKTNLIQQHETIENVLRLIESAKNKIIFVNNKNGQLVGSISDGDLRRAFLAGVKPSDQVTKIMNPNPKFAIEKDSRLQITKTMREFGLRFIPIVDQDHRILRIESLDEISGLARKDNHVILMAGGLGKRLSPLTDDIPKPLLNIGGKPILETIIASFQESGFHKITLSVNYKSQLIKDHFGNGSSFGVEIDYLDEEKPLGTCGALAAIKKKITDSCIVMNGDVLTKVNFSSLLDFHLENNSEATMGVRDYDFRVPYGVVNAKDGQILSIDEKPVQRFSVSAGIYVLSPSALDLIPVNESYDMPTLFGSLIGKGRKTLAYTINDYWIDIGKMEDFHRAQFDYENVFKCD